MNLTIRADGFSEQYTLSKGLEFWLRVVKPIGPSLVVSDMRQGGISDVEMECALAAVLGNHCDDVVKTIVFLDLAPRDPVEKIDRRRVADRFDFLSGAVRKSANAMDRGGINAYLDIRQSKFAAVFQLD